jgi:hypothetical protein
MAHKSSAPSGGADFELIPAGAHVAVCCTVAFLGWHKTEYKGKTAVKAKTAFTWELVNEKMKDGKPFTISKVFTDSLHKKADMRAMLESWRSRVFSDEELKGFEITKVLGKACSVTVIHSEKDGDTKARVSAVSSLTKGTAKPDGINPPLYYTVEKGDPESCDILQLPKWMQEMVLSSLPEPKGKPQQHVDKGDDDETPF